MSAFFSTLAKDKKSFELTITVYPMRHTQIVYQRDTLTHIHTHTTHSPCPKDGSRAGDYPLSAHIDGFPGRTRLIDEINDNNDDCITAQRDPGPNKEKRGGVKLRNERND